MTRGSETPSRPLSGTQDVLCIWPPEDGLCSQAWQQAAGPTVALVPASVPQWPWQEAGLIPNRQCPLLPEDKKDKVVRTRSSHGSEVCSASKHPVLGFLTSFEWVL